MSNALSLLAVEEMKTISIQLSKLQKISCLVKLSDFWVPEYYDNSDYMSISCAWLVYGRVRWLEGSFHRSKQHQLSVNESSRGCR